MKSKGLHHLLIRKIDRRSKSTDQDSYEYYGIVELWYHSCITNLAKLTKWGIPFEKSEMTYTSRSCPTIDLLLTNVDVVILTEPGGCPPFGFNRCRVLQLLVKRILVVR
jgi:hypothetical protein